jgi:hypothetical protein
MSDCGLDDRAIEIRSWRRQRVLDRLVAGIVGSNLARGMDVCLLCLYVLSCAGRGLCGGLITRSEESYRVYNCV